MLRFRLFQARTALAFAVPLAYYSALGPGRMTGL